MKLIILISMYIGGSLFLIFGILLTGFWKKIYNSTVASKLVLSESNDSETYTLWVQNNVSVFLNVYLFNWTNPIASLTTFDKPAFTERGPYVFKIQQLKENFTWSNNNSTVSFLFKRRFEFISELSNGSLSDMITNVNVVAVAIGSKAKYLPKWQKVLLSPMVAFNEKTLYVTRTVRELLFDGYDDKLLSMMKILKKYFKHLEYLTDKFGWWYGKNMSQVYEYNMYTGANNINMLGLLHSWNYSTNCHAYTSKCNLVQGSTGDLWPMNTTQEEYATIFVSDLCGAFALKNTGVKYVNEIEGVQFSGYEDIFDNGTKYNASTCFCYNNKCEIPSGIRNVTSCLQAPAFISFPHFYLADESYRENISGMKPNAEKHKFYITLQKDSSITMDVFARLQINILLESVNDFAFLENVPRIFIPTMWFEEYVELPNSVIKRMKFTFNIVPNVLDISCFILVIIGTFILVSGIIISRWPYFSIPYSIEKFEG